MLFRSGINVEPQELYYKKLLTARERDINLNIALGRKKATLKFREYPDADGLSTLSSEIKTNYKTDEVFGEVTKKYIEYTVGVDTLESVFSEYCQDITINFLKIDVEGYENEVLMGNNWKKYRPQVLCIESNHEVQDWHSLIKKIHYKKIFFDGLNEYFVAEEYFETIKKRFDYVQGVLSQISISHTPFKMFISEMESMQKELDKLNKLIIKQDDIIKGQDKIIAEREESIQKLYNELNNKLYKLIRRAGIVKREQ